MLPLSPQQTNCGLNSIMERSAGIIRPDGSIHYCTSSQQFGIVQGLYTKVPYHDLNKFGNDVESQLAKIEYTMAVIDEVLYRGYAWMATGYDPNRARWQLLITYGSKRPCQGLIYDNYRELKYRTRCDAYVTVTKREKSPKNNFMCGLTGRNITVD